MARVKVSRSAFMRLSTASRHSIMGASIPRLHNCAYVHTVLCTEMQPSPASDHVAMATLAAENFKWSLHTTKIKPLKSEPAHSRIRSKQETYLAVNSCHFFFSIIFIRNSNHYFIIRLNNRIMLVGAHIQIFHLFLNKK